MSRVDSGLGWSCDSEYFVNDAGTYLGSTQSRTFYKKYTGPAIVCFQAISNGWTGPVLVSTVKPNTENTQGNSFGQAVIDGVTWYLNGGYHEWNSSYDANGWHVITEYKSIQDILTMAGVIMGQTSSQSIPVQYIRGSNTLEDTFDISVKENS